MIPRITTTWHTPDWQNEMAQAISSPKMLLQALNLPLELLNAAEKAHALFPTRVPQSYLKRIKKGDVNDPLLKQVLPIGAELEKHPGFRTDPVGDYQSNPQTGLLHKYTGRVLLLLTGACAIHCRYCFRRHFDYQGNNPLGQQWRQTLDYIKNDDSIFEAILSGGDPLSLSDAKLRQTLNDLSDIPHLRYLRIHTRLLTTIPKRLTEELLSLLTENRLQVTIVVHINHPQELDDEVGDCMKQLSKANIRLMNQSVLLKGINDDLDTLKTLSHKLYESGILPYYIHMLDKVEGANHFDIPENDASMLYQRLQAAMPGYLVPKLVREIQGEANKVPVGSVAHNKNLNFKPVALPEFSSLSLKKSKEFQEPTE